VFGGRAGGGGGGGWGGGGGGGGKAPSNPPQTHLNYWLSVTNSLMRYILYRVPQILVQDPLIGNG